MKRTEAAAADAARRLLEAQVLALLPKFSTAKVDVYVRLTPAEVEILRNLLEQEIS